MSDQVDLSKVTPAERNEGAKTPGMVREEAVATEGMWAGLVSTEAGMVSGWHHHGEYETTIYVVSGTLRMEFGTGGADILEASGGDFVYVPPGAIHREGNPSTQTSALVVVRAGSGESVINVDGPASAAP
jgi:uncharacterized RmlC-like cupin family protein